MKTRNRAIPSALETLNLMTRLGVDYRVEWLEKGGVKIFNYDTKEILSYTPDGWFVRELM